MKSTIFKALRFYLFVTLVIVVNIAIAIAVVHFIGRRESTSSAAKDVKDLDYVFVNVEAAHGSNKILGENLLKLSGLSYCGMHVDLRAMLKFCGKPDKYLGDIHSDLTLVYYYAQFEKKDSVSYVTFENGFMIGIGFNSSSVNDDSQYKKWDIAETEIPAYAIPIGK